MNIVKKSCSLYYSTVGLALGFDAISNKAVREDDEDLQSLDEGFLQETLLEIQDSQTDKKRQICGVAHHCGVRQLSIWIKFFRRLLVTFPDFLERSSTLNALCVEFNMKLNFQHAHFVQQLMAKTSLPARTLRT